MVKVRIVQTESVYVQDSGGDICDLEVIDSDTTDYEYGVEEYEDENDMVNHIIMRLDNHGFGGINNRSLTSFNAYSEANQDYHTGNEHQTYMEVEGEENIIKKIIDKLPKR